MSTRAPIHAFDLPIVLSGDVTIKGGIHPEDEALVRCRIVTNGGRSVLSSWDPTRQRFRTVDALTETTSTLSGRRVEITGVSEQLVSEVGLAPVEAVVTWSFERKRCETCQ